MTDDIDLEAAILDAQANAAMRDPWQGQPISTVAGRAFCQHCGTAVVWRSPNPSRHKQFYDAVTRARHTCPPDGGPLGFRRRLMENYEALRLLDPVVRRQEIDYVPSVVHMRQRREKPRVEPEEVVAAETELEPSLLEALTGAN